jgi:homoserine kinase
VLVRVPASSANLGPGFDALGMALSLHLEARLEPSGDVDPAEEGHPAVKAFRMLGGEGALYITSPIPVGRGLGFSGAARVAGLVAAHVQQAGDDFALDAVSADVLCHATALEGHADNVAASLFGGVVATAGGLAVSVPLAFEPVVVVWVPSSRTSTDESRTKLASALSLDDAVFNISRTALLVAALAAGDTRALRVATEDRLHQDARFAGAAPSREALDAALGAGAWCGWLSGSGPTIAALCSASAAERVAAGLPEGGSVKMLRIDHDGAVVLPDS